MTIVKIKACEWEYKIESLGDWDEDSALHYLNSYGAEGWELVHVSDSLRTYFFKRPKENLE